MKPLLSAIAGLLFFCGFAEAHSYYTPEPGSPLRKAIMDALRVSLYAANGDLKKSGHVVFEVQYLMVDGNWACARVIPTQDGKEVGEPGWALLEGNGDNSKWTDVHYFERLQPYADDAEGDDALNMGAATVKKLRKLYPDAESVLPQR